MYLNIVKIQKLPSLEMCSDSNIHVFNGCSLHPSSGVLKGLNSPHSSRSVEAKEIKECAINLLLHLEVEAEIYILQPSQ